MTEPTTADLVATLRSHALTRGTHLALQFLRRGEHIDDQATYADLDMSARIVARNLQQAGLADRPVLIALSQGLDFVRCFLGCLYAGAIAVPTPALGDPRGADRIFRILEHAQPAALIASEDRLTSATREALKQHVPNLRFLVPTNLLAGEPAETLPTLGPDAIAFLQYTSGSTTRPKGVVITRRNIAADLAMIGGAFNQNETSSTVSWLPLHHDMGLIGCVLEALSLGATATLMSPLAFLQRPLRWLQAMDRFGATTGGAPNFAYDLCVRTIDPVKVGTLDLSRWNLAFCGSEPVRATTLSRFSAHFAAARFDARAFYPCYGLAEATLFVTGGDAGTGPRVESFPTEQGGRMNAVSCGYPRLGTVVALLDPATGEVVSDNRVGEIAVSGEQVSPGFWHPDGSVRPDAAREKQIGGRRFLRTGDLGTVKDGALYVVGRLKNMIIVRGANIYAEDVEQTIIAHPAAACFGAIAALSLLEAEPARKRDPDRDREGLAIVCEVSRDGSAPQEGTLQKLGTLVAESHGVVPAELLIVPSGAIDRTVSGKLRRDSTLARLLDGSLPVIERFSPLQASAFRSTPASQQSNEKGSSR